MAGHTRLLPRKTLWMLLVLALVAGALIVPITAWAAEPSEPLAAAAAPLDSSAAATRAEFAMLAVTGLALATSSPATPTFVDVPWSSPYYAYVEGAHAAGLVQGLGNGYFGPDMDVARQQVATILARYLSAMELRVFGYVTGEYATYATLAGWFEAEGTQQLAGFADSLSISAVHRPGVAYLAMHDIALGSNGWFNPLSSVTVGQCVAFIARTADVAKSFVTPVVVPPVVTSVHPSAGSYLGGTSVQIVGGGFTSGAVVRFGSVAATSVVVSSPTLIVATSPAGAAGSTVQVSVTTGSGTSVNTPADDFTYSTWGPPSITSLSASFGRPGDTINIYGANFTAEGLQVWFGGQQLAAGGVAYVSPTRLTVLVPYGVAGDTVRVKVVTAYGSSPNTPADDFTYYAIGAPSITGISPNYGWEGDVVHIYGTNLIQWGTDVWFGGEPVDYHYVTYYGSTHIAVVVPEGADGATVRVKVLTAYGVSPNTPADDFTYYLTDDPIVGDVVPDHGWTGDVVTIYGHNFSPNGLEVWFGSEPVDSGDITYFSSTKLQAVVPGGYYDGQTVRVTVVTDYGTSANTPADDFTYVGPEIVVGGIDVVEYSLAGAGVWEAAASHVWVNNTQLDFRMRVVDRSGVPLADANVSAYFPWCYWTRIAPLAVPFSAQSAGEPPLVTVTDQDGYLYWSALGGFSDSTYAFMLGLRLRSGPLFYEMPGPTTARVFSFTWSD